MCVKAEKAKDIVQVKDMFTWYLAGRFKDTVALDDLDFLKPYYSRCTNPKT